jgi:hypothetical protein
LRIKKSISFLFLETDIKFFIKIIEIKYKKRKLKTIGYSNKEKIKTEEFVWYCDCFCGCGLKKQFNEKCFLCGPF